MKKIILLLLFLLPIYIISYSKISIKKAESQNLPNKNYIVYLRDKSLSLDLDDYLFGVVGGEMPALFNQEALKAQAVASRSYLLSNSKLVVSSTINDQLYLTNYELKDKWGASYAQYSVKIKEAIAKTKNEVITRNGKILKTYYFSMSNGYTEDSQTVFNTTNFTSVASPYELSLPNFEVNKEFTKEELLTKLNLSEIEIEEPIRDESNHVKSIKINGKEYTGIEIRKLLNLRSTDFTIIKQNDNYIFKTKGYGHGVGMSQYGANEMAKQGKSYIEILKYYYQNTKISKC